MKVIVVIGFVKFLRNLIDIQLNVCYNHNSRVGGADMKTYFPGTVIERNGQNAEEFLFGVCTVTKGLMLAQVREITGLETPAIQNWVNRGWVQKPVDKRYGVDHLARIIIINMLRGVMKLETIASLLTYINGEAGNEQDNVVSEARLYYYLCAI